MLCTIWLLSADSGEPWYSLVVVGHSDYCDYDYYLKFQYLHTALRFNNFFSRMISYDDDYNTDHSSSFFTVNCSICEWYAKRNIFFLELIRVVNQFVDIRLLMNLLFANILTYTIWICCGLNSDEKVWR